MEWIHACRSISIYEAIEVFWEEESLSLDIFVEEYEDIDAILAIDKESKYLIFC
jgi:hypothetical protein